MNIEYKVFRRDGRPMRANAKCTFMGSQSYKEMQAEQNQQSPDVTHKKTVKQQDRFTLLAEQTYNQNKYYIDVASANGLLSFRKLETGQNTVISTFKIDRIMAVTPYTPEYNTLQLDIFINGENEGLHTVLKKAEVHYELNKIPYAKLHFISSNPDIDPEDNPLQSDVLSVTDEIELKVTSGEESETLFKGIVYKVAKNADPSSGFETKIDCKDLCVNLTSQLEVVADETFAEKMDRFLQEVSVSNEVELGAFGEEVVTKTQNVSPWDYIISYLDGLGYMTNIREGIFYHIR